MCISSVPMLHVLREYHVIAWLTNLHEHIYIDETVTEAYIYK